jgi:DNA-binding MarR family transcriptional regulator
MLIIFEMSDIYAMPGHLIRRLQQIATSVFADHMKTLGLDMTSPQFAALSMIANHPKVDQATLAGLIACDRPTIGGVIDRLVAKGFVQRHTNPNDRRAKLLMLTDEGQRALETMRPVVERAQDAILPSLSQAERAEFIRLAAKIAKAGNQHSRVPLHVPEHIG